MHYHSRKARLAFHHSQITQNQAGSTPCSRNLAGHQDYTEPELESSILTPSACNTMHQSRIAVLIDGDNAYLGYLERVMAEAGQHGVVVSRRIYGGSVVLDSWLECIRRHGFEPTYAEGPDAADNALANDAMEMLSSGRVNRFYIVASDNGFAKLARQIREEGAFVVGIGASDKELSPFKDECDAFTRFANLPPPDDPDPAIREFVHTWEEAVKNAVRACAREDGWAEMADIGNSFNGFDPDFYRDHCHVKPLSLVKSCPDFNVDGSGRVRVR